MKEYLLQLMMTKGIGEKAIKKIIKYMVNTGCSMKEICETPDIVISILDKRNNIQETIENIKNNASLAKELSITLDKKGIKVISEIDKIYPVYLKETLGEDCPPVLFAKGNTDLLSKHSVGFCGSRKVSKKGKIITEQCADLLAKQDITVVSGYASGTDMAAHCSAVKNGGNTVFVLAEGILNFEIKQHIRPYLNDKNHVFVSQFLPTTQWYANNAMKRNGVIIGLSRAMILVESGRSGGTFAAGEETLKRRKPLFVIDFDKPEVSAEANPYFIEHGGKPIRGINGVPSLKNVISEVNKTEKTIVQQIAFDDLVYG